MAKKTVKAAKAAKASKDNTKGRQVAKGVQVAKGKVKPERSVYFFGNGKADGNRTMKDTLGGKGSGLAEMTNAGLPVPPGFTISTQACNLFYEKKDGGLPAAVEQGIGQQPGRPGQLT